VLNIAPRLPLKLRGAKCLDLQGANLLTTLRSQVMAAKDLAFFERLFSTTSDKLLRAYSAHSIEQAREMAFRDTRLWELLLLDIGIKMHGRPASELWSTYYLACRETLL
ncbi:hypothetical protein, partial [Aeromonas veronii]|uniref:hypothetical protein n=1 Tax=Aeromonas veronii TaxID=654 RepID=UPI003D20D3FD